MYVSKCILPTTSNVKTKFVIMKDLSGNRLGTLARRSIIAKHTRHKVKNFVKYRWKHVANKFYEV